MQGNSSSCGIRIKPMRMAVALLVFTGGFSLAPVSEAGITELQVVRTESPTFGGTSFGTVGQYEKIVYRATGAVNPSQDYLPTPNAQTVGLLAAVNGGTAQQGRAALFGVLTGTGLLTGSNGDLALLASGAGHLFSDSPMQQN